jgi:hypothetical protein
VDTEATKALILSDFKDQTAFSALIDQFIGKATTPTSTRKPEEKEKEEEEKEKEEPSQIIEKKDVSIFLSNVFLKLMTNSPKFFLLSTRNANHKK